MTDNRQTLSALEKAEYKVEALTPVTMHGADGVNAEFRIPSLKGMMRYWFRLLSSETREDTMQKKEEELFGSAVNHSLKSSVWITANQVEEALSSTFRPSHSRKFTINALKEGSVWDVCLSSKKSRTGELAQGKAVFEAAVLMGGFGQRGRHGASAFHLVDDQLSGPEEYLEKLQTLLTKLECETSIDDESKRLYRKSTFPNQQRRPYWLETQVAVSGIQLKPDEILKNIRLATHNNADRYKGVLGGFNPRFPAPLHTSIVKFEDGFAVTVTEINHQNSGNQRYLEAKEFYVSELIKSFKKIS